MAFRLFRRGMATAPGLMQDYPLSLHQFVWRAETMFAHKNIITNTVLFREIVFISPVSLHWHFRRLTRRIVAKSAQRMEIGQCGRTSLAMC